MRLDRAVVWGPIVGRNHHHAVCAALLRVPRQRHGLIGRCAGAADQHGNAAVDLCHDEGRKLAALIEREVHDLAGAAQREDPMHASPQEELDVPRVRVGIDTTAFVEQGYHWWDEGSKATHRSGLLHGAQIVVHIPPRIGAVLHRDEDVAPHSDGATDHFSVPGHLPAAHNRRDTRLVENPLHQEGLGFVGGLMHPSVIHHVPRCRFPCSTRAISYTVRLGSRCACATCRTASFTGTPDRKSPRRCAAGSSGGIVARPDASPRTGCAPATTSVSSPRGGGCAMRSATSDTVPRTISSNFFVSSLITATCRSPRTPRRSRNVRTTRCGASNMTSVQGIRAMSTSARRRSPALRGRNPRNTNRSVGSPATDSAAVMALAPGTGTMGTPAATACRTSVNPGSDSTGVPASDTSATDVPSCSRRRSSCARVCSLCS